MTNCLSCNATIPVNRQRRLAKYCSKECEQKVRTKQYRDQNPKRGQHSSAATGAISEMLVCADLLYRGYSVFRSISPACECDILVLKDGVMCRIEVKTAYRSGAGKAIYSMSKDQHGKHDVLALVFLGTDLIEYRPVIDEWFTDRRPTPGDSK